MVIFDIMMESLLVLVVFAAMLANTDAHHMDRCAITNRGSRGEDDDDECFALCRMYGCFLWNV